MRLVYRCTCQINSKFIQEFLRTLLLKIRKNQLNLFSSNALKNYSRALIAVTAR